MYSPFTTLSCFRSMYRSRSQDFFFMIKKIFLNRPMIVYERWQTTNHKHGELFFTFFYRRLYRCIGGCRNAVISIRWILVPKVKNIVCHSNIQGLVKGAKLCFRYPYFYFWHGESTSTASQLTSPASQKSKDLNKVSLLLQDLGMVQKKKSGIFLCLNPYFFCWLEKWVGWL